jgi:UDP-N-acetylmuramate dehydrogenase
MIEKLKDKLGDKARENVSLKEFTSFKVGGPAKYFVEVDNKNDLRKALDAARELKLAYYVLSGASNVLVSDNGFDGLVIKLADAKPEIKGNLIKAFAGVKWPKLVIEAINSGLEGLEFSANIPGSVGGSVRGNAGAYGQGVGDFVKDVEILVVNENEISLKTLSKQDCEFAYRESIFKKNPNWIISEAVYELNKSQRPKDELIKEIKKEAATRCAKQPLKYPSAGCTFKNVVYTEDLVKYKDWASNGKIAAGKFVDEAGLKGKQIGGAKVSEEHANFIINVDNATASDIVQLISLVKTKVRDEFGVQLEEEIVYVGF